MITELMTAQLLAAGVAIISEEMDTSGTQQGCLLNPEKIDTSGT